MVEEKSLTVTNRRGISQPKIRDSNLELFRIITMFLIVAHHCVVNSGLTSADGSIVASPTSSHSLFLLLFGAWGKIGINCFVMITGYFMCRSRITVKKFAKLICEVMFYKIVFYSAFLIAGYEKISLTRIVQLLLPVSSLQQNFTGCFITFFLFIPFLNILVQHLDERQHIRLLLLLSFTYILFGTVRGGAFGVIMNYVSWFMVLYFIASYIRIYPKRWFSNNKICAMLLIITLVLSISSVICCAWLGIKVGMFLPFYFVTDSNTLLAVLVGVFAFLFFKNLRISYNKFINTVAASTFGVLLIHANSDVMRQWLWNDLLDIVGHYNDKFMLLYVIGCVLGIYIVCTVIDFMRINLLERPLFIWWDKHWDVFYESYKTKEEKIFQKLHID